MKKNVSVFFLLIILTGLLTHLTSCKSEPSSDVNQDKIYTEYELFYDANQDKTYARAWFKFSNITGTLLELASPSKVTFNGDVLTFNSTLAYYEKEYAGKISSGTFVWTNTDGVSKTNSISMTTIDYPTTGLDTIHQDSSYELHWVGDSLSANQHVILTVTAQINESTLQIFSQDDINSKSIILAKNQLQLLPVGGIHLYMDRSYTPSLTQLTTAGGTIKGRYRPVNKLIQLK
jgi:hypothetical protein